MKKWMQEDGRWNMEYGRTKKERKDENESTKE
jgi:hypothetical protein